MKSRTGSFSIRADRLRERYALLRQIEMERGLQARLVVQEFLSNAAKHGRGSRVDLTLYPDGLVALDYGGGYRMPAENSPGGGFGLTLICAFGGAVTQWDEGMRLDYRFPPD